MRPLNKWLIHHYVDRRSGAQWWEIERRVRGNEYEYVRNSAGRVKRFRTQAGVERELAAVRRLSPAADALRALLRESSARTQPPI